MRYNTLPSRPRVLVLAPTIELAAQVGTVARSLAHHVKLKVLPLEGSNSVSCPFRARMLSSQYVVILCIRGLNEELICNVQIQQTLSSSLDACAKRLAGGADVIVGTPGKIHSLWRRKHLYLSQVQHIVLDEADTLVEESFWDEVQPLIGACRPDFRDEVHVHSNRTGSCMRFLSS